MSADVPLGDGLESQRIGVSGCLLASPSLRAPRRDRVDPIAAVLTRFPGALPRFSEADLGVGSETHVAQSLAVAVA